MAVYLSWILWLLSLVAARGQGPSCLLGGMARYLGLEQVRLVEGRKGHLSSFPYSIHIPLLGQRACIILPHLISDRYR